MWRRLTRHWFLVSIALSLLAGYFATEPIRPVRESALFRDTVVFVVMTLMGLVLSPKALRRSITRPGQSLLAIAINIAVVPLLALPFVFVLSASNYGGLIIATLVPCTLASASVWTRRAGGDDSIAIFTTVVTNLACVVVVPLGMYWLLSGRSVDISAADQVTKLATIVVAPLLLAQVLRRLGADVWADTYKLRLSLVAQLGILVMVALGAAAGTDTLANQSGQQTMQWTGVAVRFTMILFASSFVHLVALAIGIWTSRFIGGDQSEQIAVGLSGSQKTLMVGLQISIDAGVSVLPMIVYHVTQLLLDTLIADRWRSTHQKLPLPETGDPSDR